MRKRIAVLTTETAHHNYFVNRLLANEVNVVGVFFETQSIAPPFAVGPVFEAEERKFEKEHFFSDLPESIPESYLKGSFLRMNSPEAVAAVQELEADLGIVFGCGKLKGDILSSTRDGLINIHRGIAEEYRGLDSDLWAIYHRDYDNLGVSVHRVEKSLDTGDILREGRLELSSQMRIHQLRYYTSVLATDLVLDALRAYEGDSLNAQPQKKKGRYYSFMPRELKLIMQERFDRYCSQLDQ